MMVIIDSCGNLHYMIWSLITSVIGVIIEVINADVYMAAKGMAPLFVGLGKIAGSFKRVSPGSRALDNQGSRFRDNHGAAGTG